MDFKFLSSDKEAEISTINAVKLKHRFPPRPRTHSSKLLKRRTDLSVIFCEYEISWCDPLSSLFELQDVMRFILGHIANCLLVLHNPVDRQKRQGKSQRLLARGNNYRFKVLDKTFGKASHFKTQQGNLMDNF